MNCKEIYLGLYVPMGAWGCHWRLWLQSHMNVRLMLGHCLQCYPKIKPTLVLNSSSSLRRLYAGQVFQLSYLHHIRGDYPMLAPYQRWMWASVNDGGPTLIQLWIKASCLYHNVRQPTIDPVMCRCVVHCSDIGPLIRRWPTRKRHWVWARIGLLCGLPSVV